MISSIHSLNIAIFTLAFTACLNLGEDTSTETPTDIHWYGSLSQACTGSKTQWIARFDPDSTLHHDSGRYEVTLNVSPDSLQAGVTFGEGGVSVHVDSLTSSHVWGTFEILSARDSATIQHAGQLRLDIASDSVSCQTGLACSDSLPSIQMEGEWTWRSQLPPPGANTLYSIVWTGEILVAAGAAGTIRISADGVTWGNSVSGTTHALHALACSPAGLVAVGDSGVILSSTDGKQWAVAASGTQKSLQAVKWTRGQYIAAGNDGVLLTSPDGSAWTSRTSGTTMNLRAVGSSSDRIIVVGSGGTVLLSTDAQVWTQKSVGTLNLYTGAWTGTWFMASGGESSPPAFHVLKSSDGETWAAASGVPHFSLLKRIENFTVGISRVPPTMPTKDIVRISSDGGDTWISDTLPPVSGAQDAAWTGERLVVVGAGGAILTKP